MPRPRTLKGESTQGHDPEWGPLLQTVGRHVTSDFMWMYEVELSDGTPLQVYKHIDTRRSIHLDPAGNAFAFEPSNRYRPVPVEEVLSAVFCTLPRLAGVTREQMACSWAALDRLQSR